MHDNEEVNRFNRDYKDVIKFTGKILPGSILKPAFPNDPTKDQFYTQGSFTDDEAVYIKVIRESSFFYKSHPLAVFQRGKKGNFFGISREKLKMENVNWPNFGNVIVKSINSYKEATEPGSVPVGSIVWASNENNQQILELKNNIGSNYNDHTFIKLQLKSIKVYDLNQLKGLSKNFKDLKKFTYIDAPRVRVIPQENTSNMPTITTTAPGSVTAENSQFEQPQVSNMPSNTTTAPGSVPVDNTQVSNMGPNTTAPGPVPVNNSQVEQTQVSSNMGPNTTAPKSVMINNGQVEQTQPQVTTSNITPNTTSNRVQVNYAS